ncbi:MAG: hypothetical protein K0Q75_1001 [Anaerospora sp.]|nr:hypothetical protein [Anaerospora sp.]
MMLKVLFVAAEAVPFIKTGGLADVIGSLPKELVKEGVDARVILPKYSEIPSHYREIMEPVHTMEVPVGWRRQYCGIEKMEYQGITFYFVDNEYYFKRKGLYGHFDDGERFAYFCRAVLEVLPHIGFAPDILHCHDWHAAAIPVMLAAHYRHAYPDLRTVLTIHNLLYQGVFAREVLGDLLSLGNDYFAEDKLEFFGSVNYMKGGLVYADRLTTVPYTWRSIGRKCKNKMKLQEHVGLPVRSDVPVVAIISRLVAAKGLDLVAHVIEEMLASDIQLIVLGTGEERYEGMFRLAAHRYPDKVSANIFFGEDLAHKIYAGADVFLMPSCFEPCGIGQLIALRYGTLPVVRETGGLKDTVQPYNEYTGEGNGFTFANYNAHDMLHTLQRALAIYPQTDIWERIVRNAMRSDYSWCQSAQQYHELYQQLV